MEKDASTRPPASAWILCAYGIVAALLATLLAGVLRMPLYYWWRQQQEIALVRQGDYLPLAVHFFPFLDLFAFLPIFLVLVPFVYADRRRVHNRVPIAMWRLVLIAAAFALIYFAILYVVDDELLDLMVLGVPMVLSALLGLIALTSIANRELTRGDGGARGGDREHG